MDLARGNSSRHTGTYRSTRSLNKDSLGKRILTDCLKGHWFVPGTYIPLICVNCFRIFRKQIHVWENKKQWSWHDKWGVCLLNPWPAQNSRSNTKGTPTKWKGRSYLPSQQTPESCTVYRAKTILQWWSIWLNRPWCRGQGFGCRAMSWWHGPEALTV